MSERRTGVIYANCAYRNILPECLDDGSLEAFNRMESIKVLIRTANCIDGPDGKPVIVMCKNCQVKVIRSGRIVLALMAIPLLVVFGGIIGWLLS